MNTHNNIQVTGIGLSCASANSLNAMFNDMAAITNDSTHRALSCVSNFASIISRPVQHLELCADQNDRVLLNTILALENAMESAELNQNSALIAEKQYLIYLVTSDDEHDIASDLEANQWYDLFTDDDSPLVAYINRNNIKILFEKYSGDITQQLSNACELLATSQYDTIFFGGVGSFMNEFSSYQAQAELHLNKQLFSEGVAFLVLESVKTKFLNEHPTITSIDSRNNRPQVISTVSNAIKTVKTVNQNMKTLLSTPNTQPQLQPP